MPETCYEKTFVFTLLQMSRHWTFPMRLSNKTIQQQSSVYNLCTKGPHSMELLRGMPKRGQEHLMHNLSSLHIVHIATTRTDGQVNLK